MAERLACLLSPDDPTREIVALGKMLARLRQVMAEPDKIKDQGFKVVVIDRRRQPQRPGLEARRNESILGEEQLAEIAAGILCLVQYHLTLWAHLVAKSEGGQSVPWN